MAVACLKASGEPTRMLQEYPWSIRDGEERRVRNPENTVKTYIRILGLAASPAPRNDDGEVFQQPPKFGAAN